MLELLQKGVQFGEKLGSDFIDVRYDDLALRTLEKMNENYSKILSQKRSGIGVTCYYKGAVGYSFTASLESKEIMDTVTRAFKLAKSIAPSVLLPLDFDPLPSIIAKSSNSQLDSLVKIHPDSRDLDYKINLVDRTSEAAQSAGKNTRNIRTLYGEMFGQKLFTNSDQSIIDWEFEVIDLRCIVTSKTDEGNLVRGSKGFGGTRGLEIFEEKGKTPEDFGSIAAKNANEQLEAKACPAGKFRALSENELTGVLAHESFGHLSEADFVVIEASPITGKIGERLGTDIVTIIDIGIPDIKIHGGLLVPYDDQGMKAKETIIVNKGILKHYLHNRGTAKLLNQSPTGNCRAINFTFQAIPRMTNTYFAPGDLTEEEALEKLGTGVYAIQTSGGQVEGDGNFVFKAIRGYWVEKGEIKYPLREVSLSGNILNLLTKIEGATKDLKLSSGYFGGCGKGDQYPLPVGDGGPKLIFSEVTFGGQA